MQQHNILDNMNFVAIDFETATAKRDSACALAMVVIEDCKIEEIAKLRDDGIKDILVMNECRLREVLNQE